MAVCARGQSGGFGAAHQLLNNGRTHASIGGFAGQPTADDVVDRFLTTARHDPNHVQLGDTVEQRLSHQPGVRPRAQLARSTLSNELGDQGAPNQPVCSAPGRAVGQPARRGLLKDCSLRSERNADGLHTCRHLQQQFGGFSCFRVACGDAPYQPLRRRAAESNTH